MLNNSLDILVCCTLLLYFIMLVSPSLHCFKMFATVTVSSVFTDSLKYLWAVQRNVHHCERWKWWFHRLPIINSSSWDTVFLFEWNCAVMLEDIVTLNVFQFTFASIAHFMVVTSPNDNLFASYLVCIDLSRSRLVQSTAFPVASLVRLFARTARTYTFSVEFLLLAM